MSGFNCMYFNKKKKKPDTFLFMFVSLKIAF
jgi:hypothetical protein